MAGRPQRSVLSVVGWLISAACPTPQTAQCAPFRLVLRTRTWERHVGEILRHCVVTFRHDHERHLGVDDGAIRVHCHHERAMRLGDRRPFVSGGDRFVVNALAVRALAGVTRNRD